MGPWLKLITSLTLERVYSYHIQILLDESNHFHCADQDRYSGFSHLKTRFMAKQLLIMRHAKSSWSNSQISDFDRPLNKRGLRVTPQVGEFIHVQGLTPDLIVSSSATRARMTAQIFLENCTGVEDNQLQLDKDFYHAPSRVYLEFIAAFSDPSVETLMFVGHNPGLEDLVERLSGSWETMPTAAVAHFELAIDEWSETLSRVKLRLKNVWRPKEIGIA